MGAPGPLNKSTPKNPPSLEPLTQLGGTLAPPVLTTSLPLLSMSLARIYNSFQHLFPSDIWGWLTNPNLLRGKQWISPVEAGPLVCLCSSWARMKETGTNFPSANSLCPQKTSQRSQALPSRWPQCGWR